jgi:hypothetical protein
MIMSRTAQPVTENRKWGYLERVALRTFSDIKIKAKQRLRES